MASEVMKRVGGVSANLYISTCTRVSSTWPMVI